MENSQAAGSRGYPCSGPHSAGTSIRREAGYMEEGWEDRFDGEYEMLGKDTASKGNDSD